MWNYYSDFIFCEIILMEMEFYDVVWFFLEFVNLCLVSGYWCIIKNFMDFFIMWEWLFRGGYISLEEFVVDVFFGI